MPETFLNRCKTSLSNLIASDQVQSADDVMEAFSRGILNFVRHYCDDDHSSSWCFHDKVNNNSNTKDIKKIKKNIDYYKYIHV